jgi:hypothetical protein
MCVEEFEQVLQKGFIWIRGTADANAPCVALTIYDGAALSIRLS